MKKPTNVSHLMCSTCKEKQPARSFSSKEKNKLNKRTCTPCLGAIRKTNQKEIRGNVLSAIFEHVTWTLSALPVNNAKRELERREMERKKMTPAYNTFIVARDKETCYYCQEKGFTADHLLPIARGGSTTDENCVCACSFCNHIKGHMYEEEFRRLKKAITQEEWSAFKKAYETKKK